MGWARSGGWAEERLNRSFKRVIWSTQGVGAKLQGQKKIKKSPNWGVEAVTNKACPRLESTLLIVQVAQGGASDYC